MRPHLALRKPAPASLLQVPLTPGASALVLSHQHQALQAHQLCHGVCLSWPQVHWLILLVLAVVCCVHWLVVQPLRLVNRLRQVDGAGVIRVNKPARHKNGGGAGPASLTRFSTHEEYQCTSNAMGSHGNRHIPNAVLSSA
jgi:hypothetical protein